MERAWYLKVGSLPRSYDEYHHLTLQALLMSDETVNEELQQMEHEQWIAAQEAGIGKPEQPRRRFVAPPKGFDPQTSAVRTGDPVADEWERQIAAGTLPDWLR